MGGTGRLGREWSASCPDCELAGEAASKTKEKATVTRKKTDTKPQKTSLSYTEPTALGIPIRFTLGAT